MLEHLAHLPNYTCRETIQRYIRTRGGWNNYDRVQLDVAFSGRRELFSPAGADRFSDDPIEKLVSGGTIGDGGLGSHVDLLLSREDAEFQYAGKGKKDGHKCLRFDVVVPTERSHFSVRHNGVVGMAGYQGSLWVDADTLEPIQVEFKVNRIPAFIGVRLVEESLHYKKLTIGNSDFYLPVRSELAATDEYGNYSLNLTKLESCREFAADSAVTYGPVTQGTRPADDPDHP